MVDMRNFRHIQFGQSLERLVLDKDLRRIEWQRCIVFSAGGRPNRLIDDRRSLRLISNGGHNSARGRGWRRRQFRAIAHDIEQIEFDFAEVQFKRAFVKIIMRRLKQRFRRCKHGRRDRLRHHGFANHGLAFGGRRNFQCAAGEAELGNRLAMRMRGQCAGGDMIAGCGKRSRA